MMNEENVPLSTLTTLKVGGDAAVLVRARSIEDVQSAVALARERALPFYVLGEGSNVLPDDGGYKGIIIRVEIPGINLRDFRHGDDRSPFLGIVDCSHGHDSVGCSIGVGKNQATLGRFKSIGSRARSIMDFLLPRGSCRC